MTTDTPDPQLVSVGFVRRAHGLAGELSCDVVPSQWHAMQSVGTLILSPRSDDAVRAPADHDQIHEIEGVRGRPERALIKLEGINDRDAAMALRGMTIWVERIGLAPTPVDQINWTMAEDGPALSDLGLVRADLLGLRIVDERGEQVGEVFDVLQYPAHSVLAVARDGERDTEACVLVPYVAGAVMSIDGQAGRITINAASAVDNGQQPNAGFGSRPQEPQE